jgi:precorrin-3B C17-methyltransferase
MKKEVDRCKLAVRYALLGKTVSMVCSGDAGVYGMAGIMYEVACEYKGIEIIVVPGITAACSAAAVLGAPLIHDFSVISLSDLLTPWEKIEKRLLLASDADFVICLYNPQSKKRSDYLKRACEIMLVHKSPNTSCGFVKNIGRDGEKATLCRLDELGDQDVDMFTTVIIGNSQTKFIGDKLVTPRGYTGI